MSCTRCGCDDWKLAPVVYAGGFTSGESSTFGGGVAGLGSDASAIIGGATSSQTMQTQLSKMAAPPEKDSMPKIKSLSIPSANKKAIRGTLIFAVSFMILVNIQGTSYDTVESMLFPLLASFVGLGYMVLAMLTYLFSTEASEHRKLWRQARLEHEKEHEEALLRYQRTKMCMRCGTLYIDEDRLLAVSSG